MVEKRGILVEMDCCILFWIAKTKYKEEKERDQTLMNMKEYILLENKCNLLEKNF